MKRSRRAHAYTDEQRPEGPAWDGPGIPEPTADKLPDGIPMDDNIRFQVRNPDAYTGEQLQEMVGEEYEAVEDAPGQAPYLQLMQYAASDNIAETLDEDELGHLGAKVCEEYDIDVASRSDWTASNIEAMKLAKQTLEKKNYPFSGASNVKYPLITKAAIEFNSRAYPALVTQDLVKCKVNGYDADGQKAARAERVSKTMSWQCLEEMKGWDEETDKLTMVVPIVGMAFKKTYFDKTAGRNVSELVLAEDLVFNYSAKSFDKCPRKTHLVKLYPYEIRERVLSGTFSEHEYGVANDNSNDVDAQHIFLEQHRLEDLDGDGYPEPYTVTVHKDTQKVCRIKARFMRDDISERDGEIIRIEPTNHFTKFGFIPNIDGSAHDIGFGTTVGPINYAVNTTLNQMIDAGHLANTNGGFVGKGLRMKGGSFRLRPGEYMPVDTTGGKIRENIVPLEFKGPSPVLFQLLGLLIEAGEDLAQIKDVLEGTSAGANQPASTTLALIEQGLKVFSGIYKRLHRSLKQEFKLIYKLNSIYMEPRKYITFLDAKVAVEVYLDDFQDEDLDISPVSDPAMVTKLQEVARAEAMLQVRGTGNWNDGAIEMRYLEALSIPNIDELRADPEEKKRAEMMQMMQMREEMQLKRIDVEAKMLKARSGAIKDIASAEAEEIGQQLDYYQKATDRLTVMIEAQMGGGKNGNGAGGMGGPGGQAGVA